MYKDIRSPVVRQTCETWHSCEHLCARSLSGPRVPAQDFQDYTWAIKMTCIPVTVSWNLSLSCFLKRAICVYANTLTSVLRRWRGECGHRRHTEAPRSWESAHMQTSVLVRRDRAPSMNWTGLIISLKFDAPREFTQVKKIFTETVDFRCVKHPMNNRKSL